MLRCALLVHVQLACVLGASRTRADSMPSSSTQIKALQEELRVARLEREHMSAHLQLTDQRASALEADMREKEAVRG